MTPRDLGLELARSEGSSSSAQRLDVKLRAAGRRPASSGAPLAAHPIMPVQVARRRANSRSGSRLGRREKLRRTVKFNDELARADDRRREIMFAGLIGAVSAEGKLLQEDVSRRYVLADLE